MYPQILKKFPPVLFQGRPVQSHPYDRLAAKLCTGNGCRSPKANMPSWVFNSRINKERPFVINTVVMAAGTDIRILEGKQFSFVALVTDCTTNKQVIPIVSKPVISRIFYTLSLHLFHSPFWSMVLNITVIDMRDLGFT